MVRLLDGKKTAGIVLQELKERVVRGTTTPGLAVVLVGRLEESMRYVRHKRKAAAFVGIRCTDHHLEADVHQNHVLELLDHLNQDPGTHGILIQLPLPSSMDQTKLLTRVRHDKDVDGFHPMNMGYLALKDVTRLQPWETRWAKHRSDRPTLEATHNIPCTAKACASLLDRYGIDVQGKQVVVLGRSPIAGLPISLLMMNRGATVVNCDVHTPLDRAIQASREADIIIAATGVPQLVTSSWIKPGAVILDVGIHVLQSGRLVGDVDFSDVTTNASPALLTPVPGGIGPMTIAMLMENTVLSAQRQSGEGAT